MKTEPSSFCDKNLRFLGFSPWLILVLFTIAAQAEWQSAEPGWNYEFPRDHGNHPSFKTEWWYFTGNLTGSDGRKFGYQLTFFRQGMTPAPLAATSRFVTRDIKMAHFALSDLTTDKFQFFQKLSRGAYGEAGFSDGDRLAWIDDWSCELVSRSDSEAANAAPIFHIRGDADDLALDLRLTAVKPPVIHGTNGVSVKAAGEGRASHYYSFTRLESEGTLRQGTEEISVSGLSWFDHEWATNQLAENQLGWDWFSIQFDDGCELMLFQLRTREGGRDAFSSGTFVDAAGRSQPISSADFTLKPVRFWQNPVRSARYPLEWRIGIPKLALDLRVHAAMDNQELRLKPIAYWEGAVLADGTRQGKPLQGSGYLEMTGYAGPISGMTSGPVK